MAGLILVRDLVPGISIFGFWRQKEAPGMIEDQNQSGLISCSQSV